MKVSSYLLAALSVATVSVSNIAGEHTGIRGLRQYEGTEVYANRQLSPWGSLSDKFLIAQHKVLEKLCMFSLFRQKDICICFTDPTSDPSCRIQVVAFGDSLTDTGEESFSGGFQDLLEQAVGVPEIDFSLLENEYHNASATNSPGTWLRQIGSIVHAEDISFAFQAAEARRDVPFSFNGNETVFQPSEDATLIPGIVSQIDLFLSSKVKLHPLRSMAVTYSMGGNDFSNFNPLTTSDETLSQLVGDIVNSNREAIQKLRANKPYLPIVVVGLIPLQLTPRFLALRNQIPESAFLGLSTRLSILLKVLNDQIEKASQSVENVKFVDQNLFYEQLLSKFNVTDEGCAPGCNSFEPCPVRCDNPETYLWWDDIHPSAAAHGMIAQFIVEQTSSFVSWSQL